jgi:DNA invertase Pin-like site-specific DNA recombinase
MQRFAFYGRASDKRLQDIDASRCWQRERAHALIARTGGRIVAEYFDADIKRSVPWPQRPEARRLMDALKDPQRGFEAVVIGEPHRAFAGTQFALTYPLFAQHGVPLWVPELNGPIDPASEAHDIVMTLYAGMSAAERIRIRTRVRAAMQALTRTEGRFIGGQAPYGYRLVDAGPHPHPRKAATGQRIHRLDLDPNTAPTVRRIFTDYLNGMRIRALATQLNQQRIDPPGQARSWSSRAVTAILSNPRYTGYAVWNRNRRQDVLVDLDDVAQGHRAVRCANPASDWIWSAKPAHPAIIDLATFTAAQGQLAASRSPLPISCGHCQRTLRLIADGHIAVYRCTTGIANDDQHPSHLAVDRARILHSINDWVARSLAQSLLPAARSDDHEQARLRRELADCENKLHRHRAALEAGADPQLIVDWTRQLTQQRSALRRSLAPDPHAADGIDAVLAAPHLLTPILDAAPIHQLQQLYTALKVRAVYYATNSLTVTVGPTD